MAAPAVEVLPGGKTSPVDALMQVEEALRLLDAAMPDSRFKRTTIRSLVLYLAEMKYQQRQTPARRHLRSHYRLVK